MPVPIPSDWRTAVVKVLQTSDPKRIEWTIPARQRWETDTFGGAWVTDAYEGMIAALEDDSIEGNETTAFPGQIATYEFFFFRNRPQGGLEKMYGKIALKQGRISILILSAHRPERQTLRP
ncbi:MAG TPA: hypothetical protein VMF06_12330 [Candidatus Limnocylindria bacterium]|nr:hypothetical protein [Candidatus Limnocylindria bacterium]